MSKIPRVPGDIYGEFTKDLKTIFRDNLISIILFGSAARGEYQYKKSDINFLVLLKDNTPSELVKYNKYIKKWARRNVATPLFLTEDYIKNSCDTFPIEFFEIKSAYKCIHGNDLLPTLEFSKENLRNQAERELKGKLLHLRQEFLESRRKKDIILNLIKNSINSFSPIFRAILHITNEDAKLYRDELFKQLSEKFNLDYDLFHKLLLIARKELKTKEIDFIDLFDKYVEEMDKIAGIVDRMGQHRLTGTKILN